MLYITLPCFLTSVLLTNIFFPLSTFSAFGSLPCLADTCPCDVKSTSCIDLSVCRPLSRPRVLLKAPTLAEMEEMNLFEASLRSSSHNEFLERDEKFTETRGAGDVNYLLL